MKCRSSETWRWTDYQYVEWNGTETLIFTLYSAQQLNMQLSQTQHKWLWLSDVWCSSLSNTWWHCCISRLVLAVSVSSIHRWYCSPSHESSFVRFLLFMYRYICKRQKWNNHDISTLNEQTYVLFQCLILTLPRNKYVASFTIRQEDKHSYNSSSMSLIYAFKYCDVRQLVHSVAK